MRAVFDVQASDASRRPILSSYVLIPCTDNAKHINTHFTTLRSLTEAKIDTQNVPVNGESLICKPAVVLI